ncbi:MAG: glycosyltransferase [Planctomycetota bacterium]
MPALILPAHNEAALIGANLTRLLDGLRPDVRVLVVCNGCSDRTAEIARGFAPRVEVVEQAEPSKVAALNRADSLVEDFPRIYLDADVEISGPSIGLVLAALEGGAVAAEPEPVLDSEGASWPVRWYYKAWQALHGGAPGSVGSGLYGLSEAGRARFGEFPKVIADDGFVRAHFAPGEIQWVPGASSRVRTPRRLADLVRIKTRSRLGNLELEQRFPELWAQKKRHQGSVAGRGRSLPLRLWPALALYVPLQWWIRRRADRQAGTLDQYRWERDESSRA